MGGCQDWRLRDNKAMSWILKDGQFLLGLVRREEGASQAEAQLGKMQR